MAPVRRPYYHETLLTSILCQCLGAFPPLCGAAQTDRYVTSKYRDTQRYFAVINRSVCSAPLEIEHTSYDAFVGRGQSQDGITGAQLTTTDRNSDKSPIQRLISFILS